MDKIDLKYIEQFLINGTIKEPTESMMIPTDSLKEINENFPASTVNVVLVISFLVTVPSVNLATIFWVKVRTWKCWNIVNEDVF